MEKPYIQPKIIFQKDNRNLSKIRKFINFFIHMFPQTALILTIVGVPKLLYHIIWKKNIKALIVLAAA